MNQPIEFRGQRSEARRQAERPATGHQSPVTTLAPTIYCPPQRVEQCVEEATKAGRPA